MKNKELVELNFKELLNYGGMPPVKYNYTDSQSCSEFCISCEQKFLQHDSSKVLDQMSHGADTWDFEQILGDLPTLPTPYDERAVVFLLESPGGHYENGAPRTYQGITKEPPIRRFYWSPPGNAWPTTREIFENMYGRYFAYLLYKFRLKNAYFTNIVKCSLAPKYERKKFIPYYVVKDKNKLDSMIRSNCFALFLQKELEIMNPRFIFYFSLKTQKMGYYLELKKRFPNARFERLYHPAARISQETLIDRNDAILHRTLNEHEKSMA
jgi:hypothetical protein